jgi:hypothetical protein
MDSCASISTDEDGRFFEQSAGNAAGDIRKKYPKARTIRLDPSSDMTASKSFSNELPEALRSSEFVIVSSGAADLELRVDLLPQKVPILENVVKYEVEVSGADGSREFNTTGSEVLSAKLAGVAPEACPGQFAEFDWLTHGNPLFNISRNLVRDLRKRNEKLVSPNP